LAVAWFSSVIEHAKQTPPNLMPKDKSLFHNGNPYNKLIDPLNKPIRDKIVEVIPQGASVLDIGCGTGLLCYALQREKQCQVVGADLSFRMIEFAKKHNTFEDIQFIHQDATDLIDFQDDSFDYVIASLIIIVSLNFCS
jgi:2-polyprenyl-3-methyl-5-hydroxy-6-metoxy-1,4-benzoquinol methylase